MTGKEIAESVADVIELKFDLEKFYPFEEKIIEIFKEIEYNIEYVQDRSNERAD